MYRNDLAAKMEFIVDYLFIIIIFYLFFLDFPRWFLIMYAIAELIFVFNHQTS